MADADAPVGLVIVTFCARTLTVWVPVGVDVIVGAVTANEITPVRFVVVPIEPVTLKDIVLPGVCASAKFLIWLRLTGVPTGVAGAASLPPPPPHANIPVTTHKPTTVQIMLFLILRSSFRNVASDLHFRFFN